MNPKESEFSAIGAHGLGPFIFVVGKKEIPPPAVDVEGASQVLIAHDGTFDVPARPAWSPGTGPFRFVRLGALPEYEIHGMSFFVVNGNAAAGAHVLQVSTGKAAISPEGLYGEIDISAFLIGISPVYQEFGHLDHTVNMIRGPGFHVRVQDAQSAHILIKGVNELLGQGSGLFSE